MADQNPAIKVRFAPSPTGPLHIGGVRTALFNYLFAKKEQGMFMLRIEDTDLERSKPEFEKDIIDSLTWLNLKWDGPIERQSARLAVYKKFSDQLITEGKAYADQGAVKFKVAHTKIKFKDLVHGEIEFDTATFDDFVILKSNGYPAYNFACVVDDHEFAITHVIRGDDHLSNTPRQILMYIALGWKPPKFAHLPLVAGANGQPLSKRDAIVNLTQYRADGYLPDGLLNYLALLGWSAGGNKEFFTREDLVKLFSIQRINKTNAKFDIEKLKWVNKEHFRAMPDEAFLKLGKAYLEANAALKDKLSEYDVDEILLLFKPRASILADLAWQTEFLFQDEVNYDAEALRQYVDGKPVSGQLQNLMKDLEQLIDFSDEKQVESSLRRSAEKMGIEARGLIHPVRIAITGKSVSPSLFSVMRLLGKAKVLKRLKRASHYFSSEKVP